MTTSPESSLSDREESSLSNPPPSDSSSSGSDSDSDSDELTSKDAGIQNEGGSKGKNGEDSTGSSQIEWLATTRSRRSTAGNRMKSMLVNEEPDSDLELLFAEDENDQGFSDVGDDASDVQMDSSSDDEDEANAGEEFEGEQELERLARERQAAQRKRRAQATIPAKFRKKVRIDTSASGTSTPTSAPAPRPKKKSERTSWLPSPADLPTRASSRKTTRMSKEQLHQQMVEREAKRLQLMEQMQKKAARMEALKKPPMTQEGRLQEAAIVEKRNSQSLNRWEIAEKQREEERRAKLAALHERTLKGPVVTFWSALGEPRRIVVEEEKPQKRKREKADKKDKDKDKNKVKPDLGGNETTKENGSVTTAPAPQGVSQTQSSAHDAPSERKQPGSSDASNEQTPLELKTTTTIDTTTTISPAAKSSIPHETREEIMMDEKEEPKETVAPAPSSSHTQTTQASTLSSANGTAMPPVVPSTTAQSPLNKSSESKKASPVLAMPSLPQLGGLSKPPPLVPPTPTIHSAHHENVAKASSVLAAPTLTPPPLISQGFLIGAVNNPRSNVLAPPNTSQHDTHQHPATTTQPLPTPTQPAPTSMPTTTAKFMPRDLPLPLIKSAGNSLDQTSTTMPLDPVPPSATSASGAQPSDLITTRNVIILQNFDENAIKDKAVQTEILFGRRMNRLSKPPSSSTCVITNLPARYRDPKTGLPFHNMHAYRELQRLGCGEHRWSKILNAWVGSGKVAAKGVPERFLNPNAPSKKIEAKVDMKVENKVEIKDDIRTEQEGLQGQEPTAHKGAEELQTPDLPPSQTAPSHKAEQAPHEAETKASPLTRLQAEPPQDPPRIEATASKS